MVTRRVTKSEAHKRAKRESAAGGKFPGKVIIDKLPRKQPNQWVIIYIPATAFASEVMVNGKWKFKSREDAQKALKRTGGATAVKRRFWQDKNNRSVQKLAEYIINIGK